MDKKPNKLNLQIAIFLLVFVFGFSLILTLFARARSSSAERINDISSRGRVAGETDNNLTGDVCSKLGIEYGVPGQDALNIMNDSANSIYFDYELGVTATAVCPTTDIGSEVGAIDQVLSKTGSTVHILRLGYGIEDCSFQPQAAASKINEIVDAFGGRMGQDIFIMPVNEPRTELEVVLGNQDPVDGANWLNEVVNSVKDKDKKYLIFPAFNFHNADNAGYTTSFLSNYNAGDDVFANFGLSIQYDDASTRTQSFNTMIEEFMGILDSQGISGYHISLFGANTVNTTATQEGFADSLLGSLEKHGDIIDGIYIFTPWGWQGGNSANQNQPIPEDVWSYLFSECGKLNDMGADYECRLYPVDKKDSLTSCESEGKDIVYAGVKVKLPDTTKGEKEYRAHAVITEKIKSFTLVNWLGNSNIYSEQSDQYMGTLENPYMPPCGKDLQIASAYQDLTRVFSGTVRLTNDVGDTFDYKMPNLGNALACMIWRATDTEPGPGLYDLEPRFNIKADEEVDFSSPFSATDIGPVDETGRLRSLSEYDGSEDNCNGLVNRIDETDKLSGDEFILQDLDFHIEPEEYTEMVRTERILTTNGTNPYLRIDGNTTSWVSNTKNIEILGAGEALAQMYKDEVKTNPWKNYSIIHRDQSGVKVTLEKRLYDAIDAYDYKTHYDTSENCNLEVFIPENGASLSPSTGGGQAVGESEFIIPWLGQTVNIMKRNSEIFTLVNNENTDSQSYLEERRTELKLLETSLLIFGESAPSEIQGFLTAPSKLFMCSDLDKLSAKVATMSFSNQKVKDALIEFIDSTDCLATKNVVDPLNQWLCEQDLLSYQYCQNQCIPFEDVDIDSPNIISSVDLKQGALAYPFDRLYRVSQFYKPGVHPGMDIGVYAGTPILASAPGKIVFTRYDVEKAVYDENYWNNIPTSMVPFWSGYGNMVAIDHGNFYTIYAHMSKNSIAVKVGDTVETGTIIGKSGNTGHSSGPHLHFEIRFKNCTKYNNPSCSANPLQYLTKSNTPIDSEPIQQDAECYTADGRPGYLSAKERQDGIDWEFKYRQLLSGEELSARVKNLCALKNMPSLSQGEMIEIVQDLGTVNDKVLKKANIDERNEVRAIMVSEIYRKAANSNVLTSPELLVAIWFSENGMNPKIETRWLRDTGNTTLVNLQSDYPNFSDVFGCGVYCEGFISDDRRGLNNFTQELACATGTLVPKCQVYYNFDIDDPGEYLDTYGPAADGNATFADKVMYVLEAMAMRDPDLNIETEEDNRVDDGQCVMRANPGALGDWFFGLLNNNIVNNNPLY